MSASRLRVVQRASQRGANPGSPNRERCVPFSSFPAFSMAFQPIVDVDARRTAGYEALVRGPEGESAATVLDRIVESERYAFDEMCRVVAIEKAALLGLVEMGADLCINFYPNAEGRLEQTMRTAAGVGLPLTRVIFEISELEQLRDPERLRAMVEEYRRDGLRIAIDDFGAGFAGLSMLAAFQPDIVKIDLQLTEKIEERRTSRVIVRGVQQICADLGIQVIAEGVEEPVQMRALRELGIRWMQGNLFAPAAFEALPVWSGATPV